MRSARAGVLLMAFGTPSSPDEIEPFYTRIRRGRPPSADQLENLEARYEAIGGSSPLAQITEAQRAAIENHLSLHLNLDVPVVLGQRYAAPFITDALEQLADEQVTHTVALVLSPHYSKASIGGYLEEANEARLRHGIEMLPIEHWHLLIAYVDFLAGAIKEARAEMPSRHAVLFSAHSLPEAALTNDPYPEELRRSAEIVATRLGLREFVPNTEVEIDSGDDAEWALTWQSAGDARGPWRGPDIKETIRSLQSEREVEGVVICPQGFAADNLEILFDLDLEAKSVAEDLGLRFARTRSINADGSVMSALAELIAARLRRRKLA